MQEHEQMRRRLVAQSPALRSSRAGACEGVEQGARALWDKLAWLISLKGTIAKVFGEHSHERAYGSHEVYQEFMHHDT